MIESVDVANNLMHAMGLSKGIEVSPFSFIWHVDFRLLLSAIQTVKLYVGAGVEMLQHVDQTG